MGLESEYANCKTLYVLPPAGYDTQESNVPVMVRIGRSAGKYRDDTSEVFDELGASYLKMAVSLDDDVTECPVEVTEWDVDRQLGILFVKIPSVPTTGMTLKLCYDSTHADNTTNVGTIGSAIGQSVWANGFEGVWHMKPSGGMVLDSTRNQNHGTIYGATVTQGPLGACCSYDGVDDYSLWPNTDFNPYNDDYTVDALINPTSGLNRAVISATSAAGNPVWSVDSATERLFRVYGRDNAGANPFVAYGGAWTLGAVNTVAVTKSGTALTMFQEGESTGEGIVPVAAFSGAHLTIGAVYRTSPTLPFQGTISFVALSSVARSPAWIALTNASLKDELIAFSTPGTESLSGNERMRLMPDGTLVADEFVEV